MSLSRRMLLAGAAAVSLGAGGRRSYVREHRTWTRELVLYRDFSTALLMRATLLSPPFRSSLALERQRLVRPSDSDHAAFVERMERDATAWHEIVFAADSSYDNALRFGPGDDRWNLRLLADGVEEPVVAVDRVRRPSPLHDALYLQLDQWSELWIARWERTVASPSEVLLIVGSGYGNGELEWDMQEMTL
jgi:hypothetical protein